MAMDWNGIPIEQESVFARDPDRCTVTARVVSTHADTVRVRLLSRERCPLRFDGRDVGQFYCIELGPIEASAGSKDRQLFSVKLAGILT